MQGFHTNTLARRARLAAHTACALITGIIMASSAKLQAFDSTELGKDLEAYWKFNNNLTDTSANGINGTATGTVSYVNGIVSKAVNLEQASSQINLNLGDIPRAWTISLWVKKQATGRDIETLLDSATNSVRLVQYESTQVGATKYGVADGVLDVEFPNDKWVHLAMVANNGTMSVYVDGFAYGAFTNSHPFQSIDLPFDVIGASNGLDGLTAYLDEFAVWSRVLNAGEIRHLYLGGLESKSIETIAGEIEGKSHGHIGPGIGQQSYDGETIKVGDRLATFDLNTLGLNGEEGRSVTVSYLDGWIAVDSRNIAFSGGLAIYDFSDLTDPKRVSHFYNCERPEHLMHETIDPQLGHYYQNNTFTKSPTTWDFNQLPAIKEQAGLDYTVRRSPDVQAYMVPPYAYYGQYGYPRSHKPMEIWDMRTDTQIASLDFENDFGFRGVPMVMGNLMIITSSNGWGDAVATYDISDPANPIMLDLLYGVGSAYEPAIYHNKIVLPGKNAAGEGRTSIVDFTDPTNLVLEAELSVSGNDQYAHFQDNYMFVSNSKIDMNDYSTVFNFRKGNQYLMPIGNALLIISGKGASALFVHELEADTTGPTASSYHSPADGAINQATTSRVGIFIPESIDTSSITKDTVIMRELGGEQLDATMTWCDKGILNITPRNLLAENTTYEVILTKGGIKDVVGNGLESELRFSFSTGTTIIIDPNNSPPVIDDIQLSTATPLPVGELFTITVDASDADFETLEYRVQIDGGDSGWGESNVFSYSFEEAGRASMQVSVRDAVGNLTNKIYQLTSGTLPESPSATSSSTVAVDSQNQLIWTVNPDNDTITSIDLITHQKVSEIAVSKRPSSLAVDNLGRVWVVCRDDDRIEVIDNGVNIKNFNLNYGAQPHDIVYAPEINKMFVTAGGSGKIRRYDVASVSGNSSLYLGPNCRAIAINGSATRAYVSKFITEGETATVWEVNLNKFKIQNTIGLSKHEALDTSVDGRGVFNYLSNIAITPDQESTWISASKVNVDRGDFLEGENIQPDSEAFQNTVRPANCVIDNGSSQENEALRFDHDNHSFPSAIVFSPLGDYAFVAIRGNNVVNIYDIYGGNMVKRKSIATELAPDGLAYHAESKQLIVKNFMSRSVQIFDIEAFLNLLAPEEHLATIPTVANESLDSEVLLGKQIFYNAGDLRMSLDGYISCASCHDDGATDGRTFDFTERGEGLRNTTTLLGKRGVGHGRAHWSANFDEIQDFEHDIRGPQAGTGFIDDADFESGSHNTTLGNAKAGLSEDLDALAAYVASLDQVPRSPHRKNNGGMTSTAQTGENHFMDLNCAQCHSGDDYTDSAKNIRHHIGTIREGSGQRLNSLLDGIDTPTLRGIWATAPYLHDGAAATLDDVFSSQLAPDGTAHARVRQLSAADQQELFDYLLQLDGSNGPAPQHAELAGPNWVGIDIGDAQFAGSSADNLADRTLRMQASGADIWNAADAFHFYHRADITGDVEVTIQLNDVSNTNKNTKAGLMIRESLEAGAINAYLQVRPDGNTGFQIRRLADAKTASQSVSNDIMPLMLKLTRTANEFSGYFSTDGWTWTQIGESKELAMPEQAYLGVALTSHNNNQVASADFSNLVVHYSADGYDYYEWSYANQLTSSDPTGDDDNDGITNLEEYFFAKDPNTANDELSHLPKMTLTPDGPTFTYVRSKNEDILETLEVSTDMVSWYPAEQDTDYTLEQALTDPADDTREAVEISIIQDAENRHKFFRLNLNMTR
ncbi:LamG-like jellyroll fold domain-containing protein [Persicirhabdus sediminis]|uniref:Ig-like domain-containing protein n=1 Tax=Persicirhabdus sediminis TaxID=454144 RepID=A0A8J7SLY4_9BACT|nr:LamG-like jellyroll fold domain-containing protein [Persicirhabdus sediminis]MBK1791695.1 Ig-like domain-containing protein [Persicirhabdus sediminis]